MKWVFAVFWRLYKKFWLYPQRPAVLQPSRFTLDRDVVLIRSGLLRIYEECSAE
jgi:hypothetical protein